VSNFPPPYGSVSLSLSRSLSLFVSISVSLPSLADALNLPSLRALICVCVWLRLTILCPQIINYAKAKSDAILKIEGTYEELRNQRISKRRKEQGWLCSSCGERERERERERECVYVFALVCVYVCVYLCGCVVVYVCVGTRVRACMSAYVYVCTYT
jgi:hypothetical protein